MSVGWSKLCQIDVDEFETFLRTRLPVSRRTATLAPVVLERVELDDQTGSLDWLRRTRWPSNSEIFSSEVEGLEIGVSLLATHMMSLVGMFWYQMPM